MIMIPSNPKSSTPLITTTATSPALTSEKLTGPTRKKATYEDLYNIPILFSLPCNSG
jgi:hypothetical protein